ncbi:uncharacterized protein LOC117143902 [Drosophila mauritiana]|uniref:Uncharacterized protein LOC117143902 n=1 Tax=Drosophila mauritiana TaxID=7226 RepID=A0A6P8K729_DROMA|nr:uncharacterized protein LOC117143902 [Drosophila mauritiana]
MHATVISVFGIVYLLFLFLGHLSAQITVGSSTFNPGMIDINPEAGTEHSWHPSGNFRRVWIARQQKNNQTS